VTPGVGGTENQGVVSYKEQRGGLDKGKLNKGRKTWPPGGRRHGGTRKAVKRLVKSAYKGGTNNGGGKKKTKLRGGKSGRYEMFVPGACKS